MLIKFHRSSTFWEWRENSPTLRLLQTIRPQTLSLATLHLLGIKGLLTVPTNVPYTWVLPTATDASDHAVIPNASSVIDALLA